ncbi:uncharacterized protein LOC134705796 [Mytilus trossulus]|uniref:uncharacterized protein LOC134705796 n=1 Tax=Mytilus trossulus TaxID=6551 RepID=UPI00300793AC
MDSKLKSVRAGHKGAVTKLLVKFDELKSKTDTEVDEVKALDDAVTQKQKTLIDLNNRLLEQTSEENLEQEITDSDEYMYELDCKIRQIRKFIKSFETSTIISHDIVGPSTSRLNPDAYNFTPEARVDMNTCAIDSINQQYSMHAPAVHTRPSENVMFQVPSEPRSSKSNYHRLPKLDLPYFNGDILKWQTFWDCFESSIHFNDTLTSIQKFNYLKAQLEGSAAQTVEGFALTNGNYETAVNLLRDRFGQPSKLIHAYMKALMNLPAPTNDAFSLRSYGDRLESYVRGLESLGQTSEMYGSLLVPVVLDKLPIDVRKSIAREHGRDNLMLQNLRKSITKEIEILEAGQGVMEPDRLHTTAFFTGTKPRSHNKGKLTDTRKKVNTHTCIFCSGQHYPTECSEVTDANARNQIVKQKQLCFNCLGSHRVAACKSTKRCKNCNGMHHTSICKGKEVITDTKQEPKIQQTAINVVETSDTTSVLHASQVSPDILLKTATAPVIYNDVKTECNILFDEGALRSFITQKLADKLEIKTTGKVSIQLSAFGDLSQKVRNLETATIQLQIDTGENVRINTLIVPEIAVPIHNSISHTTKSLPHLRGLKLANSVHSGERFEIDLLIGADYYWEIIEDKIIRGKGPTAVQSKIGYLLSGPTIGNISQHSRSTVLVNVIAHKNTTIDNEKGNSKEGLSQKHNHQDDVPSGMIVTKRRAFEENTQGSDYLPRPPERTHPQLVESRSHIDTGQKLIMKEIYS